MVARPSLSLLITPPGGSATQYAPNLAYDGHQQQMSITQNFGRQGDTAILPLVDEFSSSPNFVIPPMSTVKLYDSNCSQTLFAGLANDPSLQVTGPNRNEWTLNCTDFTVYADDALIHGTWNGWTVDQIVVDITAQANCGITAATVADGGYVAPGPQLSTLVLNYQSLSGAWKTLAALAGGNTAYGWFVDENLELHFYDATTALSSGVTFTTSPTTSGSITEGHILSDSTNSYEWDGTSLFNRILVQGATQTVSQPTSGAATDTWLANGTQQAWPLRYTLSGTPTLKVGGTEVTVTSVEAGTSAPSTGWSAQQNSVGQYFLWNPVAPAAGTVLQAWYSYQVPVVAQATDWPSVSSYPGPNGGIFAEFVSDTSLTTMPMALARAQQLRTEYAYPAERFTFNTSEDFLGWVRAGYTCVIDTPLIPDSQRGWAWGVNDTFITFANQVTFGTGGYRQCQVTAIRL